MAEAQELFDHNEYFEQMAYYFSKAVEFRSASLAANSLGVSASLIEEAIELKKTGALKDYLEGKKDERV